MRSGTTEKWIVCRVCLRQPEEEMHAIFDQDDDKDLTKMVLECGGVPIKKYDHFPDKICSRCLKYLRVAYKFRIICQRSHKHLSRFIAPVVVEKVDSNEEAEFALELDDAEEIALKLEPDEEIGIKQEWDDEGEIVEMYEPMEEQDGIDSEIFEEISDNENPDPASISAEVEYLEETADDDSEEYVPYYAQPKKNAPTKPNRQAQKTQNPKPSTSRKNIKPKGSVQTVKRGPRGKNKETSYICDVCGNMYPSQGRLTEHIKLHKGIKPHECEICGHAFAQTQQLARHMNTHTGNRPYKCTYCPAAFADLSTRNKHHRIHTNERPYVCDVCGKAFTYTNTLKFHKMIHTGEKPHVCDICGKGFQQAYKLRNHKMTHQKKCAKLEPVEVDNSTEYQEIYTNISVEQFDN